MFVDSPDERPLLDGAKEHVEKGPDDDCGDPECYGVYDEEFEGSFGGKNAFLFGFCHLFLSLWFYYNIHGQNVRIIKDCGV